MKKKKKLFKDKPAPSTCTWEIFLVMRALKYLRDPVASHWDSRNPPDDILNIIASPKRVCLFAVYIWAKERRGGRRKLFMAFSKLGGWLLGWYGSLD